MPGLIEGHRAVRLREPVQEWIERTRAAARSVQAEYGLSTARVRRNLRERGRAAMLDAGGHALDGEVLVGHAGRVLAG